MAIRKRTRTNPRKVGPTHEPTQNILDQLRKIQEKRPVSVCFFNNKGGVGKTTLVANLASELSINYPCRVLVIDADPQCNLTQYVLTEDEFLDSYESETKLESIYSVIHPLSMGRGYIDKLPIRRSQKFNFDIVIGDPRLALREDILAQDWRDAKSGGTRGIRTTFVFSDVLQKAKDYDFVFFDMGPSLGAINRAILLSADYFIVPMSIDIFSLWAIKNIGSTVEVWKRELLAGLKLAEDPDEVPAARDSGRIKFIGYVIQQHKERHDGESRRLVEAYDTINRRLHSEIRGNLKRLYPDSLLHENLGEIKHLGSLAPKSQTLHTPMITVSLKGSYTIVRKQAREIYKQIGERFILNVSASLRN